MKNLIIAFFLFISSILTAQTYYCVQVCSTKNPHLLTRDMLYAMDDTPMMETTLIGGEIWYRILFIYSTPEEQDSAHHNWLFQWHEAIQCTRTQRQVERMRPLFIETTEEETTNL